MKMSEPGSALTRRGFASAFALLVAAGVLAGCVVAPRRGAVVAVRPPPPRYEAPPPPPSERMVWDPGRWQWDGHDYRWVPGHYVERPYRDARWEPGHWAERNGGWVWVEGHWER